MRKISHELWVIRNILPKEKLSKMVGRPLYPLERYIMIFSITKDWISVEGVAFRVKFWFYNLSSQVSGME
ncbi:MAG TPA: hypothetical protein VIY08_05115 [Candidatus Nitrosocosmicus sp.]